MTVANAELDCALLSEFRDGDDFAFFQFAERHFEDTRAYVLRCMKGDFVEDAEEAVNTAMAALALGVQRGTYADNPAGDSAETSPTSRQSATPRASCRHSRGVGVGRPMPTSA